MGHRQREVHRILSHPKDYHRRPQQELVAVQAVEQPAPVEQAEEH